MQHGFDPDLLALFATALALLALLHMGISWRSVVRVVGYIAFGVVVTLAALRAF